MPGGPGYQAYAILTPETTYGAYNALGTPVYTRLVGDTACMMQVDPMRKVLRDAGGGNRRTQNISSRSGVSGKLHTAAYPTQAQALLDWALNISGGDLPSYTVDLWDTVEAQRFLGVKVKQLSGACAMDSDEGIVYLDFDLVGQKLDTTPTLTAPAYSSYPSENPFVHTESATGVTLGSTRASYRSLGFKVMNDLDVDFEELPYASTIAYCGRTIDLAFDFKYLATTDRAAYENQTAQAAKFVFTKASPSKVLTLDFKGQGRISKRNRALPLGGLARQQVDFEGFYDGTAGTDLVYSVA